MVMDTFSAPHFRNDEAARKYLEGLRWPGGPVCPHCGAIGHAYAIKPAGTYRCAEMVCRKNFTVTMNSPMERSHIALHKWVQAFHLMCSRKKGVSAHQLHRTLDITYRSAWFMAHRIRECMRSGGLAAPMGGEGKIVEADETYYGPVETPRPRNKYLPPAVKGGKVGPGQKRPIVALVERGGNVRTFHVPVCDQVTVEKIVTENIARKSRLHTDESRLYFNAADLFATHETVKHSAGEYVRGDVHTNSAEGFFSIFKRGMRGIYQHCKEKHLHRYLAEYEFRYNHRIRLGINDGERAALVVVGGNFLDPEQRLAVRAAMAFLQQPLEGQKRGTLHEKHGEGRQAEIGDGDIAVASLPGSGKPAQTARKPAKRDGNRIIHTVNHFSGDLGILKICYF
jgi:transposase-like protein